jgi:hypothetical protein
MPEKPMEQAANPNLKIEVVAFPGKSVTSVMGDHMIANFVLT